MTLACRHAWLDIQGVLHNSDSIEYIFQDKIVVHKPAGQKIQLNGPKFIHKIFCRLWLWNVSRIRVIKVYYYCLPNPKIICP